MKKFNLSIICLNGNIIKIILFVTLALSININAIDKEFMESFINECTSTKLDSYNIYHKYYDSQLKDYKIGKCSFSGITKDSIYHINYIKSVTIYDNYRYEVNIYINKHDYILDIIKVEYEKAKERLKRNLPDDFPTEKIYIESGVIDLKKGYIWYMFGKCNFVTGYNYEFGYDKITSLENLYNFSYNGSLK